MNFLVVIQQPDIIEFGEECVVLLPDPLPFQRPVEMLIHSDSYSSIGSGQLAHLATGLLQTEVTLPF